MNNLSLQIDTADLSAIEPEMSGRSTTRSLREDMEPMIGGLSHTKDRHNDFDLGKVGKNNGDSDTAKSADNSVNKARIENSDSLVSKAKSNPVVVLVSFKFNNVSKIDPFRGTFVVNISLFYHWEDPSLIGRPLGHVDESDLSVNPDIIILNDLDLVETSEHRSLELINTYTGAVKQSRHFKGRVFLLSLDLADFPFDCHNLSLNLRSKKKDFNNILLEYFSEESTVDAHPQHEWLFHGYTALTYTTLPKYSTTGKIYSSLHVVVQVQRNSGWYINNVLIPFFALTCVSWTSYSQPEAPGGVYDLSVLILAASLINKHVVSERLAKVPYRTLIDWYVDCSFLCQLFSILSVVLKDWLRDVNWVLLYVNVGVYTAFHLWFLLTLWAHSKDVSDWKDRAYAFNNVHDVDGNDRLGEGAGGSKDLPGGGGSCSMGNRNFLLGAEDTIINTSKESKFNDSNLSMYAKLGWTKKKKSSRLARFGLNQDIILENEEEEEEEEEEWITVSTGGGGAGDIKERSGTVTSAGGDSSDVGECYSDVGDGNGDQGDVSSNASPTTAGRRAARRRNKLAKDYIANLERIHAYQETRPEVGKRLRKHGLTADYAKPQLEKMISAGTFSRASVNYGDNRAFSGNVAGNGEGMGKERIDNWSTGAGGTMPIHTKRSETSASFLVGGTLNMPNTSGSNVSKN